MTYLDYFFCFLLGFGALGHFVGTFKYFDKGTGIFVWSLSGTLAALLLLAFNLLRIRHPELLSITYISLFGNLAWCGIVVLFGQSVKNMKDPRVIVHLVAGIGLFVCTAMYI